MQIKRLINSLLAMIMYTSTFAQEISSLQAANATSLQLYNQYQWTDLFKYGKNSIDSGVDFPLLRMRTGYAAFMLGNYSESMRHYESVYRSDNKNEISIYYLYLNNLLLNNLQGARYYASLLGESVRKENGIIPFKISQIDAEFSQKTIDATYRGDASYTRFGLTTLLGYKTTLHQSVSFFNQMINEPALTTVNNNNAININQKDYYAKADIAVSGNLTFLGGFHYFNVPFNNLLYHNFVGFGGLNYAGKLIQLKGLLQAGTIRSASIKQFDAVLTTYPLGNTKFYTISRAAFADDLALTQVLGYSPVKRVWLEGNATFGSYRTMLNNDAMYLYDDIDQKKSRYGASVYLSIGSKLMLRMNYTHDVKIRYGSSTILYNQQSITGGLQCNF
jgi:hypothetical protein